MAHDAIYKRKLQNQELSFREFSEKKLELKSRPSKVLVELSKNCNFKCRMCSHTTNPDYERYKPEYNMRMEIFEKVATELFDDAYLVDLRGFGESTILPQWPDVVDRLADYPLINWHIITNLSLPRDNVWEKMVEIGFMIGFSCDAATKKTFESIRVGSRFETVMRNLEVVSDSIKRHARGLLYFIVVVQRDNIHELPALVELAARYEVREVQFKGNHIPATHETAIQPSQARELQAAIERSLDLAIGAGVALTINDEELLKGVDRAKLARAAVSKRTPPTLNFPPASDKNWTAIEAQVNDSIRVAEHQKCFKPYHLTYVGADGRVGTCNHMLFPRILEMGDLNKQSFEEIWNGEKYKFFRGTLVHGKPLDTRCKWCFKHRRED